MKNNLVIAFIAVLYFNPIAGQQKGADIKVNEFQVVNSNQYRLECTIRYVSTGVDRSLDHYLFFFLQSGTDPLKLLIVEQGSYERNNFILDDKEREIQVTLLPKTLFKRSDFVIYPVLIEGRIHEAENKIQLITDEFSDVNDIEKMLSLLYRFKQKPLTYAEVKR